ncbi:hypothetical protein ABT304_08785 [Nocardioides sp. NPDC000445]|uniref:hypothetical protein n=1 Tax=Nocardioides sp. NPDC000445 TaxID=3154257 RepID=UPI0033210097
MTTPSNEHASAARESSRRLAHTTRNITDPTEIYDLVGNLSLSITSLAQSLHQIAKVHDRLDPGRARVAESARSGRATSYAVSWELHRAAEILIQAASGLDRAHQDEARIAYGPPEPTLSATNNATPAATAEHLLR